MACLYFPLIACLSSWLLAPSFDPSTIFFFFFLFSYLSCYEWSYYLYGGDLKQLGATRAFVSASSSCGSWTSLRKAYGFQAAVALQRLTVAGAPRENETGRRRGAGDGKTRQEGHDDEVMMDESAGVHHCDFLRMRCFFVLRSPASDLFILRPCPVLHLFIPCTLIQTGAWLPGPPSTGGN